MDIDGNYEDGDGWDRPPGSGAPVVWKEDDPDHETNLDHNWVIVDDLLIDVTADQFNDLIRGPKFPPVYLEWIKNARRYTAGEQQPPTPDDAEDARTSGL